MNGWIGVDLDGTLAHYEGWQGHLHIGPPVEAMVERVKAWRRAGIEVRIFTARCSSDGTPERTSQALEAMTAVEVWSMEHLGEALPVTNVKDYGMRELWDDRAVQVVPNEGRPYVHPDHAPMTAEATGRGGRVRPGTTP
jgi:hypothetical protein